MSIRVDTASLISGAIVCGNRGLGVLGSTILTETATGDHGAGFLYNDVDPGDESKEFRGLIVTPPSGEFFAYENGAYDLVSPGGFVYRLYVDGIDLGTATASITIGATSTASLAVTTSAAVFAGGATVSPIAVLTATTDAAAFAGSASVSPIALLDTSTDSAIFSGSAGVGTFAYLDITTDSSVFSGAAFCSPITTLSTTTDAAVFIGSASAAVGGAVWPTPDQVLSGITYGPAGADYTGTATAGGYPTAADIAAAVRVELAVELAMVDATISSRATVAAIMGYNE